MAGFPVNRAGVSRQEVFPRRSEHDPPLVGPEFKDIADGFESEGYWRKGIGSKRNMGPVFFTLTDSKGRKIGEDISLTRAGDPVNLFHPAIRSGILVGTDARRGRVHDYTEGL